MKVSLAILFLLVVASHGRVAGQTAATGALSGSVVDPSGARIPAVSVAITDQTQGSRRETETNEAGEYNIPLLRPGSYTIELVKDGFEARLLTDVVIRIGETITLETPLALGSAAEEVEVVANVSAVEPERSQQASYIGDRQIENLPINRRNYLDFAMLSPGVVETNTLVDDQDFRVAQTPQSGLSFGGSNGRGNMFAIDGVEHYSNSGGVRPSVSQSAVREFQINRSSYSAEIGGGFGGAVNIVTKAGGNEVHGEMFGFLRHRSIQARNYFDPQKSAFTRGQYGASAGGALKKNKTFIFGAYERLDRNETTFVPILQDRSSFGELTASQTALADFFGNSSIGSLRDLAGLFRNTLTPSTNPRVEEIFEANSGVFPFSGDVNLGMVRVDLNRSEKRTIFARGSIAREFSDNADFGSLVGVSRGRSVKLLDSTWALGHTYILSPQWVSDTRAAYSWGNIDVQPLDPFGPEINITGFGSFGRDIFLPSTTTEQHWQLRQDFIHAGSKHAVKFGVNINPVRDAVFSETFFGGRFTFGNDIPLSLLFASATGDPAFGDKLGALLGLAGGAQLIPNLDDPLTALQGFAVNAPIFYQQGFGDPNWTGWSNRLSGYFQDDWRVTSKLKLNLGLRYDYENNPDPVRTDPNNIGPRFGFAYSPDRKTVIRGGFGLFYSQINIQVANIAATLAGEQVSQVFVPLTGAPGVTNPMTGESLTSADVYQTLLEQDVIGNRTITPDDLAQFGLRPGPGLPGRVEFGIVDDFSNPYAQQGSFEIERAVGKYGVSAAYVYSRGAFITRTRDHNLFATEPLPDGTPQFGFFDPTLLQQNIFESTANSFYNAGTLTVSRRAGKRLTFTSHYTWSKAIDEVTDFNSDFQPHNQLNARAERALSAFHQGHRFVANAVISSGIAASKGQSFWRNMVADTTLSPIVVLSSFRPFNLLAGFDNLGDNHPTTHRPLGAGRNIGRGPDSQTFDLRLSRIISVNDRVDINVTGEVFNALNRTNFAKINNIVGDTTVDELPDVIRGNRGAPTTPLAFTSALDPRQFQLGLRILF